MKISTFFILAWLTTLHSVAARRDRSLNRRLKGGKGGKGKGGSKNDDDDGGGDSTTPATGDTSTPQVRHDRLGVLISFPRCLISPFTLNSKT